ncbi:MAG: hypothetical protein PVH09_03270 [Chromatiales bacterium]|jgi:hypothetical protein
MTTFRSGHRQIPVLLMTALLPVLLTGCQLLPSLSTPEPASREYKLLLELDRFDRSRMTTSINEIDRLAAVAALRSGVTYAGSLREPVRTREVAFLDVPGKCSLRQQGLVLRLRSKGSKTTATLKYRTPQLSGIAAASNPLQEEAGNAVEVDLKPPHDSIYSQSLSAKIKPGELKTLGDLYALFPVTGSLRKASDTKLAIVGKTRIREQVRGKALLDIGSSSSMSLSFWYHPNDKRRPVIAELSFRYETVNNDAENEARAQRLFEELQALDGWVSPLSMTKTAFLYSSSPDFCEEE